MRRGLTDALSKLAGLLRRPPSTPTPPKPPKPSKRSRPTMPAKPAAPSADLGRLDGVRFEYAPDVDGDPDPGEVVWTWVPYEEDPSQGKDRPVLIVGRHGALLVGVALTSKRHPEQPQVPVGTGPWDREGRPSYARIDRVLDVVPDQVRREGSVLARERFDDVVDGVRRLHS
jgi:hypothetical protein